MSNQIDEILDQDLRELMERQAQIEEMTQHPGWKLLIDAVRQKQAAEQEWMILGYAKDITEYKEKVGWNKGVMFVFDIPKRLAAEVNRLKQEQLEHGRKEG